MIQLTEEQSERLRQIREQHQQRIEQNRDDTDSHFDIDFLLSLLDSDSQAATLHYFKNGGDGRCITCSNLKLWQYHVDEEIDPATSMRDKCVEKVKARLAEVIAKANYAHYTELADLNPRRAALEEVKADIELLTLEPLEPEKQ